MTKHTIASSGSAEILCQKTPRNVAIAGRLREKRVERLETELKQTRSQLESANQTIAYFQIQQNLNLKELLLYLASDES